MRILPMVTAVLVCVSLYFLIFERDRLFGLAGREAAAPAAAVTAERPEVEDTAAAVAVVAIHSVAVPVDTGVLLRGQTEAARQVEVRAETSGPVVSAPLRRGAMVEAGTLLCEIDAGTRPAALAEAEARLTEAEISANAATKLQAGGYTSETAAAAAAAGLQAAQAGVEAARKEIERTRLTAPFNGLLETDAAETGSLLTTGGLCATIIALDPIKLVGFIPETEVDKVKVGALAGARLVTGHEVRGRVTFLSRAADPETRTFRVEVEVANPDLTIRDGQTVEILVAADGAQAHLIPASALTLDDTGRLGVRTVDATSKATFVPVEVIRDTAQGVYVTGLPETADIIVLGQEYVTDGVTVAPAFRGAAG
ncbi:efflux RND transporter periplasmic adaptor subunit [Albidovulum sediminicola]|uniref:Efflux RND transporter periplasmic adaptor subunit n=1 Tax=Albidovulum sediminicola TaxID=2984331 RepID=A0ABT2Z3Z0_9RHOB|nr:efflux RND transporter periplasmic adaptor subunit [Defluviimonas sp. WL0075]MCV2865860.1 efflux RND transporter periplasmic adaptor subunit [Defluviimonas sp. WL0075]